MNPLFPDALEQAHMNQVLVSAFALNVACPQLKIITYVEVVPASWSKRVVTSQQERTGKLETHVNNVFRPGCHVPEI